MNKFKVSYFCSGLPERGAVKMVRNVEVTQSDLSKKTRDVIAEVLRVSHSRLNIDPAVHASIKLEACRGISDKVRDLEWFANKPEKEESKNKVATK